MTTKQPKAPWWVEGSKEKPPMSIKEMRIYFKGFLDGVEAVETVKKKAGLDIGKKVRR